MKGSMPCAESRGHHASPLGSRICRSTALTARLMPWIVPSPSFWSQISPVSSRVLCGSKSKLRAVRTRLDNKVAVVTGAAQGIGRSIALHLARSGAEVVLADLDVTKARQVVAELKEDGLSTLALEMDVSAAMSI